VNYIIHFLECYEAWKVGLQWVTTHGLEGSDLEFERKLAFKELYYGDFEGFFYEKQVFLYNVRDKIVCVRTKYFYFI